MLKNYFFVALRNLRKQKLFSIINVFGMAVGMAGFGIFAISAGVKLNAEKFHKNAERIYGVIQVLPDAEKESVFPDSLAQKAMGITGFTLPTMYRWIRSERGRRMTLHPFQKGHFLGSGQAEMVLAEAGLDGKSQYEAILRYVENN